MDSQYVVHPNTKTNAILKTSFIKTANSIDEITVTAYSYDIEPRVDVVSVFGGDGRYHDVNVPWDEYIPLENSKNFYVTKAEQSAKKIASRNGLCIYN